MLGLQQFSTLLGTPGLGPLTVTWKENLEDASDLTTYTFSGADLGTPDGTRHIFVAAVMKNQASSARRVSTLTVNGASAVFLARVETSNGSDRFNTEFWVAKVTSGSTGDIVVTWDGACHACAIGTWETHNLKSTTPVATATDVSSPFDVSVNTQEGGVVFAACHGKNTLSIALASSWVGATERWDNPVDTAPVCQFAGADSGVLGSAESPRTVTVTLDTSSAGAVVAVSMR